MGDISIIARRLTPKMVQYGWSGNGGYYSAVGALLLEEYNTPERVEYLFSLGQLSQPVALSAFGQHLLIAMHISLAEAIRC